MTLLLRHSTQYLHLGFDGARLFFDCTINQVIVKSDHHDSTCW